MNYIWHKLFNRKKYLEYKYKKKQEESLIFYNSIIKNKLNKINESLYKNKELSFSHSGHLGDLIYSLPLIKELSKKYTCNFFININKKNKIPYPNHPSSDVMLNEKIANLLLPLLKKQNFLNNARILEKEKIDIDLDLFRDMPINIHFHSVKWYSHLTGTPINMTDSYLNTEKKNGFANKITIARSPRYRNQYINYKFLKNITNIVCGGLKSEIEDLKKDIPNLEFHECRDFLELAEIINSSRFFIGNQSFPFSIAEALKVPRLLEACPDFPVIFPIEGEGYDFYHQSHFEKYFRILNGN